MRPLRTLAAAALATAGIAPLALLATASATHAATTPPTTVPAIRNWTAGTGSFSFTSASRVVVDPAYAAQLTADANTFAADLSALEGRTVAVAQGTAGAGDIALTLGGTGLPAEGYTMTVGSSISIQGGTTTGEFWGTRTVLQMLHQGSTIAAGTATDSPAKAERGLMIDTGRRFFDVPFVENQIRDMAYLKMNYFHLHLSDTFGFRLESSTHPEITSAQHYSKQDIADIIAVGNAYHVQIVPEIDTPGHMDAILSGELSIGKDYRLKDSSGNISSSFIDLSIPGARTLLSDLITEYEPLFTSSPYWHIGADEYVTNYSSYPQLLTYARANYGASATAKDTYYGYINWADGIVRAGGKTTRMWNDGIKAGDGTISPNADIIVEYWYNYGLTPQQLINAGHIVANESWDPTYYVYGGAKPNTTWMYETWQPDLFQGSNTITDASKNLGSVIHVWCDNPSAETQDQTAAGIKYPMRDLAQMTWGTPKLAATYAAFVPIMDAVGRNPLWPAATPIPGDLAQGKPTTASSTETSSFPAANATDGDLGTRWSSAYVDPTWLQVDLGSTQTVNRVVLAWEAAYAKAFQVQISADGTTWTTLYSTTTGTGGTQTLTGFTGSGRYIRMYGTQRGTTYGYSLWEFEVFHDTGTGNLNGVHTLTTGGKALDDPGSSTATGTQLITWTLHGGANQQWTFAQQADGSYTLTNGVSHLCADVNGGSTAAGAKVIQWTCTGGTNQEWTVTPLASGGYTVKSVKSGLLMTTASTSDGALVTQQADTNSALQHWTIG
jgi:hexosaminidase